MMKIKAMRTVRAKRHPLYALWSSIRSKCLNKKDRWYPSYGARGITLDHRWLSFRNFRRDMGSKPQRSNILRIDADGPFSPDNCMWAPMSCTDERYGPWNAMRHRCGDKNSRAYKNYGGRGITVCKRWGSPALFMLDMGPRPTPKHTLDRIDNNGNYEPGNCRWATRKEQARNTRISYRFKLNGNTYLSSLELASHFGVSRQTVVRAASKYGEDGAVKHFRARRNAEAVACG